jgi:N-acetyl-anhydromuramyl-L-alanine amidase AmpD
MSYLPGLHDRGGEHLLQGRGWVLVTEAIGCDPHDHSGADYTDLEAQGLGVIVRLNNGYHPGGTLPTSDRYEDFAARCGNWVAASQGCHTWIVGNETNMASERPGGAGGEVITPAMYARAFTMARTAIKAVQPDAIVVPAAVAPWNVDTGDWIQYQTAVLEAVECDGVAIHTYGEHGEAWMDSLPGRRYGFWAYRDLLEAIPQDKRHLPVYLTEMNPNRPWSEDLSDTEWVRRAYAEIDAWNHSGGQVIHCAILYRWGAYDVWHIDGKPGPQAGLLHVVSLGYKVPQQEEEPMATLGPDPNVPYYHSPRHGYAPAWLILHDTEGPAAAALAWWRDPANPGRSSAHWLVKASGEVVACVPERYAAHHAGGGTWPGIPAGGVGGTSIINLVSIGIELEYPQAPAAPAWPAVQLDAAMALARRIVAEYRIPADHVLRHGDVSPATRTDPRAFDWRGFLARVFGPDRAALERAIGDALQGSVVPLNPNAAFERAGAAKGLLPAGAEADVTQGGVTYRAQAYRSPGAREWQEIVYCAVGEWSDLTWFRRRN